MALRWATPMRTSGFYSICFHFPLGGTAMPVVDMPRQNDTMSSYSKNTHDF